MRIFAVLILLVTIFLHARDTIELLHHDSAEICCIDSCCGHADENSCCENGQPCNPFDNCSHCLGFIHGQINYANCAVQNLNSNNFPPTLLRETEVFLALFRPPCNI